MISHEMLKAMESEAIQQVLNLNPQALLQGGVLNETYSVSTDVKGPKKALRAKVVINRQDGLLTLSLASSDEAPPELEVQERVETSSDVGMLVQALLMEARKRCGS